MTDTSNAFHDLLMLNSCFWLPEPSEVSIGGLGTVMKCNSHAFAYQPYTAHPAAEEISGFGKDGKNHLLVLH